MSLPARMQPQHETEIKLEVPNPRELKRLLAKFGFRAVEKRHFESNHLFDFPDLRLQKARRLLRLRFARNRWLLTFKGAPLPSRAYKIRGEIETAVGDGDRLRQIFETLGLGETFRYDKFRTVFVSKGQPHDGGMPTLVYDETPIGNYLELEGPERWIDQIARQLGYRREDYITASYAALYRRRCEEQGQKPGNMVFPAPRS